VVGASLPAKWAAEWWRDLFDFRGVPVAVRRLLPGVLAADAQPDPQIREVQWRSLSVRMIPVAILPRRGNRLDYEASGPRGRSLCGIAPTLQEVC
jgi:hypothetical protein